MIDRTPEPDLMLGEEQARAYAAADFAQPHDHFIALLKERLPNLPPTARAIDLGCGPADIACRFARAFPDWTIDAVDGSPAMLELGRLRATEAGFAKRIRFHELFLPASSLPGECYALIFSNSLLHHLRDPAVLWSTIRRCAQSNPALFIMDLLRPASRSDARALVAQYAADEAEILRTDFYNSLLAAYQPSEVKSQLAAAGLGHLNLEIISDRHFIVWGRLRPDEPARR